MSLRRVSGAAGSREFRFLPDRSPAGVAEVPPGSMREFAAAVRPRRAASPRAIDDLPPVRSGYSHSIVAGGFEVTS